MMASAFAGAVLTALAGCGSSGNQNSAIITGTVTYKGVPIKGGNMTFYHSDKGLFSSTIDENGRFVLRDAPSGTLRVTVDTESINPDKNGVKGGTAAGGGASIREKMNQAEQEARGKAGQGPGGGGGGGSGPKAGTYEELIKKYTKIPDKYRDKEKTDLKIEAVNGKQEVTLELLE